MIELYGMSSPNVRKVVIALEEMALPYRRHHVGVFRARNFDPAFLALNPIGKVPVLVDPEGSAGPGPLIESASILLYLGETYGKAFLPTEGAARYATINWLMVQAATLGPALGQHSHFRSRAADNDYAARRFRQAAAALYRRLDARLAEAAFLAGPDYSIADMATYPWARYLGRHGMARADLPHLVRWIDTIAARPAVARAATVIDELAVLDAADRAAATPEETDRFFWRDITAPSAAEAAAHR